MIRSWAGVYKPLVPEEVIEGGTSMSLPPPLSLSLQNLFLVVGSYSL